MYLIYERVKEMMRSSLLSVAVVLVGALCVYSDVPPPTCPPPTTSPVMEGPNVAPDGNDPTGAAGCIPGLGENTSPTTATVAEQNAINTLIGNVPLLVANGVILPGDRVRTYRNIRNNAIDTLRVKYPADPWPEMKDIEVLEIIRQLDAEFPPMAYYADGAKCLNRAIWKNLWRTVWTFDLAAWTAIPDMYLALGDLYEQFYIACRTEAAQTLLTDPATSLARSASAAAIMPWVPYTYRRASAWNGYAVIVGARLVGWELIKLSY